MEESCTTIAFICTTFVARMGKRGQTLCAKVNCVLPLVCLQLASLRNPIALVCRVRDTIKSQIAECRGIEHPTKGGKMLAITIKPVLSMIDGKIMCFLTNTNFQDCAGCGCKAKCFNKPDLVLGRRATHEGLLHGCQPLHAWIRFLRHLLNLSYRIPVHERKAKGQIAKDLRASKKAEIQDAFLRYGLRIDFPAPGGRGCSMDENSSRRAFKLLVSKPELLRVCS